MSCRRHLWLLCKTDFTSYLQLLTQRNNHHVGAKGWLWSAKKITIRKHRKPFFFVGNWGKIRQNHGFVLCAKQTSFHPPNFLRPTKNLRYPAFHLLAFLEKGTFVEQISHTCPWWKQFFLSLHFYAWSLFWEYISMCCRVGLTAPSMWSKLVQLVFLLPLFCRGQVGYPWKEHEKSSSESLTWGP